MKKDIEIPEVKKVHIAAVQEEHEEFKTLDWNVYIINNNEFPLETVLVVSRGYGEGKETSTMRHKLDLLPARSFAKIEFLQEAVLALNNAYSVSYFTEGKMYHRTFLFPAGCVGPEGISALPLMKKEGILL